MSEDGQPTATRSNVITEVQNSLANLDPDSMCVGFVTVVEWIEPDGTPSMSVLHTQMAPWHLMGLLSFANDFHIGMGVLDVMADDDERTGGEADFDDG